ncbi:MAG: NADH-quinone oxidoreductase subunit NuoN [Alphaproteobacteria bacterium]|nr:NADH-quinone oxidoreductase subunit NuoN [Alphaproteobacteria bacterium]MBV8548317.1 NADH-quinone oxidoreductase subunit NuoN [Alphaproteobacteria bacterium]
MDNLHSLMIVLPEVSLAALGLLLLLVGLVNRSNTTHVVSALTVLSFIITAATLISPHRLSFLMGGTAPVFAFGTMFVDDTLARFIKLLILAASALSVFLSGGYLENHKIARPEYPVLILFATLGMMLMVSASDMIALYVGLELQSLALYVLAAFQRDDAKSSESGLKYFVLGALSSGLLLYGISLLYGYAGTTDFVKLSFVFKDAAPHTIGLTIGLVFVTAALAFKVSAVPFHMWTPDVYEGAPTPVAAFFASAPKMAALVLFLRLLREPFMPLAMEWQQIVVFIAVASMLLGSFAGLAQKSVKRLMAYSSIANVGYALSALAIMNKDGLSAMLIYLAIYFVNTLGAFGVIISLRKQGQQVEAIEDFAGIAKKNPLLALAMTVFMFSLAGVPPLAGFFGKYFIFLAAVKAGMVPLAVIAVVTSVVAAFYYLRLIKVMYFDESKQIIDACPCFGVRATVTLAALYMIIFTVWPQPIIDGAIAAISGFIRG